MTALEALVRFGPFIPVMTQDERVRLAMGELRPSVYQICGWCRALMEAEKDRDERIEKAMKKAAKPPENRK